MDKLPEGVAASNRTLLGTDYVNAKAQLPNSDERTISNYTKQIGWGGEQQQKLDGEQPKESVVP